jgi:hypothetical protein
MIGECQLFDVYHCAQRCDLTVVNEECHTMLCIVPKVLFLCTFGHSRFVGASGLNSRLFTGCKLTSGVD